MQQWKPERPGEFRRDPAEELEIERLLKAYERAERDAMAAKYRYQCAKNEYLERQRTQKLGK